MNQYLDVFVDNDYPGFVDKYLATNTLDRLRHVTQFCGCDYTNLYSPLFKYTRFDHSLVVAHMTWHFTHEKKETIAALLHDIGTPCFAHCIDYVMGDYLNQESSEKSLAEIVSKDPEMLEFLKSDGVSVEDLVDCSKYHILENKSPKLCTDRLDGVLHTCYIWLHTHALAEIKEVYDDMTVLTNEDGEPEIGFTDVGIAEKFATMVYNYAKELQGNTDKFVMQYVAEIVKLALGKKLISLEDLYEEKEEDICGIFEQNFPSWRIFAEASNLIRTEHEPEGKFYVSFETKKRNAIPLVYGASGSKRITDLTCTTKNIYDKLKHYKDNTYAYVDGIKL